MGATRTEVEACRVEPDPDRLEEALLRSLERERGPGWATVVALVLAVARRR